MKRLINRISLISLPLLFTCSMHATAQDALDRIVAIADEGVILESEVDSRLENVLASIPTPQQPNAEQMVEVRKQVIEQLILESLQLQMAEQAGLRVNDNLANQLLTNVAENNGLTFEELRAQLDRTGEYNTVRENLVKDFIMQEFRQRAVEQRISISRQEIENYLRSEAGISNQQPEYHIAHITIPFEEDGQDSRREELAQLLYDRINNGESILAIANEAPILGLQFRGGDLGWNKAENHPSVFGSILPDMKSGDVSEPFTSSSGFHIVQVLETRGGVELIVEQTHIQQILIQTNEIRNEQQAQELVFELYDRIMAGEDFGDIARQNTDDMQSIVQGGDLGWVNPWELPEDYLAQIEEIPTGTIGRPFQDELGWNIVRIIDRREQDMTEENKYSMAEQILRERKFEMELENWLTELRDTSYVRYLDE